mmetsp:Transcript_27700/g.92666  ORF Transcript_27700/g.92666 Transcript_27700/m.92666 type:complete len:341 (-) Transcript_27700:111-1133(-)
MAGAEEHVDEVHLVRGGLHEREDAVEHVDAVLGEARLRRDGWQAALDQGHGLLAALLEGALVGGDEQGRERVELLPHLQESVDEGHRGHLVALPVDLAQEKAQVSRGRRAALLAEVGKVLEALVAAAVLDRLGHEGHGRARPGGHLIGQHELHEGPGLIHGPIPEVDAEEGVAEQVGEGHARRLHLGAERLCVAHVRRRVVGLDALDDHLVGGLRGLHARRLHVLEGAQSRVLAAAFPAVRLEECIPPGEAHRLPRGRVLTEEVDDGVRLVRSELLEKHALKGGGVPHRVGGRSRARRLRLVLAEERARVRFRDCVVSLCRLHGLGRGRVRRQLPGCHAP